MNWGSRVVILARRACVRLQVVGLIGCGRAELGFCFVYMSARDRGVIYISSLKMMKQRGSGGRRRRTDRVIKLLTTFSFLIINKLSGVWE